MAESESALIFIDTNIILDFYRVPEASLSKALLTHIDKNHSKLITSDQVQMEYKKNRQKTILDSLNNLKAPEWGRMNIPAFLRDAQATKVIGNSKEKINEKIKILKKKIDNVLTDPENHDPVYQTFQRLFNAKSQYNLTRQDTDRYTIRRLARKRFILGYPPRKDKDNSIGDAINWEWIIQCAQLKKRNVVIVSRDGDYGIEHAGSRYINDWLKLEFKERVSRQKQVNLTEKLSEAFEMAKIHVGKKTVEEERQFLDSKEKEAILQSSKPDFATMIEQIIFDINKYQKSSEDVK